MVSVLVKKRVLWPSPYPTPAPSDAAVEPSSDSTSCAAYKSMMDTFMLNAVTVRMPATASATVWFALASFFCESLSVPRVRRPLTKPTMTSTGNVLSVTSATRYEPVKAMTKPATMVATLVMMTDMRSETAALSSDASDASLDVSTPTALSRSSKKAISLRRMARNVVRRTRAVVRLLMAPNAAPCTVEKMRCPSPIMAKARNQMPVWYSIVEMLGS